MYLNIEFFGMTFNSKAGEGHVGCNLQPVNHMECRQKVPLATIVTLFYVLWLPLPVPSLLPFPDGAVWVNARISP
jgi:hypothetical protein